MRPLGRTALLTAVFGLVLDALEPRPVSDVKAGVANAPTVLLIGAPVDVGSGYARRPARRRPYRLITLAAPGNTARFPPLGKAYRDNPEAHYLWRWIAMQAPDLVLVAGEDPSGLVDALSRTGFPTLGAIPARLVSAARPLDGIGPVKTSAVRREIERRVSRSPLEVARALEPHYGHEFKEAVYIPAMALMARMRLGQVEDVRSLARPFLEEKDSLAKPTASHLSGHLLFALLAESSSDKKWLALARKAADLGFNSDGSMKESMPLHNEMSDSVFMGCPILAKTGALTGERKYFDMAVRHFRFMSKLCRRSDGLYRHSPLDEAAWGRGNAFPALGLALTLAELPKAHADYAEVLAAFQELIAALAKAQDPVTGMWRQVVDLPGSYPEFSATAMIGRSMLLGVRNGWLDGTEYNPRIEAAWRAVSARVSEDGQVMDVCESTGKQRSVEEYLNREAIWGHDPRGGGMALMFAVERMAGTRP